MGVIEMSISFYIFIVSLIVIISLIISTHYNGSQDWKDCTICTLFMFVTIPALIVGTPYFSNWLSFDFCTTKEQVYNNEENYPKIAKYIQAHWFKKNTLETKIIMPNTTIIVDNVVETISVRPDYESIFGHITF